MSRILLTGATGFIGGQLADHMQGDHELYRIARHPPSGADQEHWIEQDLSRPLEKKALPDSIDVLIHLAQSRHYKDFPDRAGDIYSVNVESTFRLLEFAREAEADCFVYTSTGAVYDRSQRPLQESTRTQSNGFYAATKLASENLVQSYQPYFQTVILRPFFVYGPGQRGMLIPTLLERVLEGRQITIEGNPGIRINPIYVDDVVRGITAAGNSERSSVFNICGDEILTLTELVKLMGEVVGSTPQISHTDEQPPNDLIGDNSRMKTELGVHPRVELKEGLRAMVDSHQTMRS